MKLACRENDHDIEDIVKKILLPNDQEIENPSLIRPTL